MLIQTCNLVAEMLMNSPSNSPWILPCLNAPQTAGDRLPTPRGPNHDMPLYSLQNLGRGLRIGWKNRARERPRVVRQKSRNTLFWNCDIWSRPIRSWIRLREGDIQNVYQKDKSDDTALWEFSTKSGSPLR